MFKRLLATCVVACSVHANYVPSETGNFFYTQINSGSTTHSTLHSIHSTAVYIGSQKQNFSLTINPNQSGLTVFKKGSTSCTTDNGVYYDPSASTTSAPVLNEAGKQDQTSAKLNFLEMIHVGESTIYGKKYKDNVYLTVDSYFRETAMNIQFNVVDSCVDTQVIYEYDGVIGIAPRKLVEDGAGNMGVQEGFMDQLQALNKIDHQVVSLYIRNAAEGDNNSIAKFGSWDRAAIQPNTVLTMLRAFQDTTWGISADTFQFTADSSSFIQKGVDRQILFDPSVPFLYMPYEDWQNFASGFSRLHPTDAVCESDYCYVKSSCSEIPSNLHQGLEFRMFDIAGSKTFLVDYQDMLVSGEYFEGADASKCYIGVFKTRQDQSAQSDTTWILGTAFMDKYYTIFDNTLYNANSYPQIGLGSKDPNIHIFQNQYDNSPSNTNFAWQTGDQSYSTLEDTGLTKPVTIAAPPNDTIPDVISVVSINQVPNAIDIPKKGSAEDPAGESTFQKYKTYIFGVTAFLVLALIVFIIACYCKKKNQYGPVHNLFSDEHVSLSKKYIN